MTLHCNQWDFMNQSGTMILQLKWTSWMLCMLPLFKHVVPVLHPHGNLYTAYPLCDFLHESAWQIHYFASNKYSCPQDVYWYEASTESETILLANQTFTIQSRSFKSNWSPSFNLGGGKQPGTLWWRKCPLSWFNMFCQLRGALIGKNYS